MSFSNINLILIGIGIIIGTTIRYLIKRKTSFCSERYFNKLESKYGNIDRKKTVKLDIFYSYLISFEYITMGLFIKKLENTIIVIIVVAIITTILYYLIRKRYIVL
ncbi:hypothetical protein KW94_11410 [Clostridioides difficile]|nr:hypothetical protein KW94_11410 [Clostridioides difficile]